ncbi:MAG: C-GCAxxG-C-C family protein [Chloroflexi bacterium]|nr:C-GCAxxG-C-C family protein [Chloroflexota bacterium]
MSVVDISFDHPLKLEERATMPLAGGLMQNGYQCGMLWGAALAAGAQAYRLLGLGPQSQTEAIIASQRLVESFRARNKEINCAEIIEMNWKASSQRQLVTQVLKFFLKGGPIGCFSMAAKYAPVAFSDINSTISEKPVEAPPYPVSCAAVLAQKMGVSDMHTVMAAGFAGGIGLSGGACGALGAAIWIIGMNHVREGDKDFAFNSPIIQAAIERFLESADYEFECSKIVGRKFENVADHACYLRDGGCSKIIEALATPG